VTRTALGPTQSPIQWLLGALCLGVKRPGREAEIKNAWSYYLHSPIRLHGVVLKGQGQLYLTLLDGVGQLHTTTAIPRGKDPLVPIE
jgi:hypothetical protein